MAFPEHSTHAGSDPATTTLHVHRIPGAHGHAFKVRKGEHFRIVDLQGEQIVDFAAWVDDAHNTLHEKVSMAYTRYHLSGATPAVGESLWTNADRPLLKITRDTVHVHDMTFMSCFPKLYIDAGFKQGEHRSCAGNIVEAMEELGCPLPGALLGCTDPFNIFQNTPNYSLKRLGSSRPGDFIEFEALEDCICAASSCPYDLDRVNGGKATEVGVVTGSDVGRAI